MWELDHKESWALKSWYFWIVVLEKTLESPLDCQEIKPVNPKVNQPWTFVGRTDAEAEALILWPPDRKSRLIGKDTDAGKHWRQKENWAVDDEGWDNVTNWMDMNLSELWELVKDKGACMLQSMGLQNQTQLSDWITTNSWTSILTCFSIPFPNL